MAKSKELSVKQAQKPAPGNPPSMIKEIVKRHRGRPGAVLAILEETQRRDEKHYLSEDSLRAIAAELGESLARIYSVASFYSFYNLKPQGRHVITVCRGTACHTRGSLGLLEEALAQLGASDFREDEEASFTTEDALFTVRTVACFGQCALAPVVAIDGTIYSKVTTSRLCSLINTIKKGRGK